MSPVTVSAVLFGDREPATALAAAPGWRQVVDGLAGGLAAVSAGGRLAVERELAAALAGLLGLDLGDVLVGAWRKHRALVAAAEATRESPAATELVQLATHRVTTTHRPYVTVAVDGATVATVHFDLSLTLDVDGLLGQVRQGRLVALEGGRCTVAASLGCGGHEFVTRRAVLDPAITVRIGEGIALLK
jgi:hypothetical protein